MNCARCCTNTQHVPSQKSELTLRSELRQIYIGSYIIRRKINITLLNFLHMCQKKLTKNRLKLSTLWNSLTGLSSCSLEYKIQLSVFFQAVIPHISVDNF